MKREQRGFRYALEPLRSKCEWELQELLQKLADYNKRITDQVLLVKQYEKQLSVASKEFALQQVSLQIIYVDKQRIAQAYIQNQCQQLTLAQKILLQHEEKRDVLITSLYRLQKFADGLKENRDEEIKSHAQQLSKNSLVEADEAWLRTMYWRQTQ